MAPNWQRNGLATKEDAMIHIFTSLKAQEENILKAGLLGYTEIQYAGQVFMLGKEQKGGMLLKLGDRKKKNKK